MAATLSGLLLAGVSLLPGLAWGYEEAAVTDGGSLIGSVKFVGPAPKLDPIPAKKNRDVCGQSVVNEALVVGPKQYEKILTYLARAQGVGNAGGRGSGFGVREEALEDPWSSPIGRAGNLLIRAKCAPHFRRIIWELDPTSPLLKNYAHGSCPAGKYYCRITPEGDVTPCPYMPVSAGNLRRASFADLWGGAKVFSDLREPKLGGRCGACEFGKICGGCRCRAYATSGDYLAEDPACGYQPGGHGGQFIDLPVEQTFGIEVRSEMIWEDAARERLNAIPSFARGMVVKGVEAYARSSGRSVITRDLLQEVREKWGARFRPMG